MPAEKSSVASSTRNQPPSTNRPAARRSRRPLIARPEREHPDQRERHQPAGLVAETRAEDPHRATRASEGLDRAAAAARRRRELRRRVLAQLGRDIAPLRRRDRRANQRQQLLGAEARPWSSFQDRPAGRRRGRSRCNRTRAGTRSCSTLPPTNGPLRGGREVNRERPRHRNRDEHDRGCEQLRTAPRGSIRGRRRGSRQRSPVRTAAPRATSC